jgi:Rrf2 family protein
MITRTGLHAIKAMAVLAELAENEFMGATTIADKIHAPRNYLGKLLQMLSKEGLVQGQKGFSGGFRLARPASEISLFEIIEPIEHVSRMNGCFLGKKTCSEEHPCAVHENWKQVRGTYLRFLEETRLDTIANG